MNRCILGMGDCIKKQVRVKPILFTIKKIGTSRFHRFLMSISSYRAASLYLLRFNLWITLVLHGMNRKNPTNIIPATCKTAITIVMMRAAVN
jgi:hypothetical protein